MCYKYLWDGIVAGNFPLASFFDHFSLDPHFSFSDDVKHYLTSLDIQAQVRTRNLFCIYVLQQNF